MPRSEDFGFGEPAPTRAKYATPLAVELVQLHVVVERVAGSVARTTHTFSGDACRIGSHESNDLVLDDPTISRFHCRIAREGHAWRVEDRGSKNGTRLDGVKILVAELEKEATLHLGDSVIRVTPVTRGQVSRVGAPTSFGALLGKSLVMQRLFALVERIAPTEIDVLVHGESGTGKELVATEIVQRSARAEGPIVVVDCGAISPSLVESELFGHVRGAFTGADRDREGAFEAADGGTLFLDEIGELPLELQPKLLRALEAREVRRVGTSKMRRVDVRVIAATHRDLEREVNRGRFREDLYYRLAKVSLQVPPLRERSSDIPLLVDAFVQSMGRAERNAEPPEAGRMSQYADLPEAGRANTLARLFSPDVLREMEAHDWPGNVRELKNYVERSVILDDAPSPIRKSGTMRAATHEELGDVPFRVAKESAISAFERSYLGPLLERCHGNVSQAARAAKMDRMYLHQLAQKHGFRVGRKA
ncbi:MAG: sigma 54-interacting transcriptional regulator [Deltaproteobacteria bacterium]|nr:sigma 54-interacting transcriptional regulator [Deltaproteobacteria bacterium]